MTTTTGPSLDLLRRTGIFAGLSAEELSRIAALFTHENVPAQETIFGEGEAGDDLYVVEDGQVRLTKGSDGVVLAYLDAGSFFGEMALLSSAPRTANAVTSSDCQLWKLSRTDFEKVVTDHPRVSMEIARVLAERVARNNQRRVDTEAFPIIALSAERPTMTIGRWESNDLVIPDPQVEGLHATLTHSDRGWLLKDEDSASGTYVNHRRVTDTLLRDGDEIWIGTTRIFLDGLTVKSFVGREGTRIDALSLKRTGARGNPILDNVSISIQPGEFVALVGGSGTGKTSLLHALNGFAPANEGAVFYNGLSLYENAALFRSVLGYVPQDDIVHPELTPERTLYYAAKLRLPVDTTDQEIRSRIDQVIDEVGLNERRHTEIKHLSGGQRKRVSLAVELLSRPSAFYLDEPTSGLDPALEGRMMALFKDLTNSGATVVVSTHVTQNLHLCDKLAWMGPGGRLVFFGSPPEALRHFKVQNFGQVYDLLNDDQASQEMATAFQESTAYRVNLGEPLAALRDGETSAPTETAAQPIPIARGGFLRQLFWLTRRYADVLVRDRHNLALLLIQAPAIALALLILFDPDIFALEIADGGDARRAMTALHMLGVSAIFLGASNAAREIAKEGAVYKRERLVGVGVVPYVLSKVGVLSVLCLIQSAALLGITLLRIDFESSTADTFGVFIALFLAAMAGLSMGLLASAVTGNSDRAMAVVPLLVIPQLIFDGTLVPIDQMLAPAKVIAQVTISKWFLELAGSLTDLGVRFAGQTPEGFENPYADAFDGATLLAWGILIGFTVVFLVGTVLVQKRKDIS
ncbi:MAG TPA: ATP-binding cassette domain-containing protein [Dehalococcoidia bacterium]|nr:ATP-binding cassette domain-containing protein [Dehalococcoidia bacterium]